MTRYGSLCIIANVVLAHQVLQECCAFYTTSAPPTLLITSQAIPANSASTAAMFHHEVAPPIYPISPGLAIALSFFTVIILVASAVSCIRNPSDIPSYHSSANRLEKQTITGTPPLPPPPPLTDSSYTALSNLPWPTPPSPLSETVSLKDTHPFPHPASRYRHSIAQAFQSPDPSHTYVAEPAMTTRKSSFDDVRLYHPSRAPRRDQATSYHTLPLRHDEWTPASHVQNAYAPPAEMKKSPPPPLPSQIWREQRGAHQTDRVHRANAYLQHVRQSAALRQEWEASQQPPRLLAPARRQGAKRKRSATRHHVAEQPESALPEHWDSWEAATWRGEDTEHGAYEQTQPMYQYWLPYTSNQ